jgi:carbamoyltransferase
VSIIIGISAYYHDSACCLLRDGELIAATQEERFSRAKHDNNLPINAFRYCLQEGGIAIHDVDCVAYYEDPAKKLARQLWMDSSGITEDRAIKLWELSRRPLREIRELLGYTGSVEFFDHHLSHAASSYYYSGFEDAAILTVDGVGEWATTTYGRGTGKNLVLFEEVDFPDSLGLLYSTITGYLGFAVNDGEYKVMGLAPYGRPVYADKVRALIEMQSQGQYRLNLDKFDFLSQERMFSERLPDHFGQLPRQAGTSIRPFHQDLARSLQLVLEEVLLEKCNYLYERTGSENLCMAGGVALNCVANGRIAREGKFKSVFIQPAAGDAGTSLGAAALANIKLTGGRPQAKQMVHANWGPAYSSANIHRILAALCSPLDFRGREPELLEAAVERLAAGKVVGWFQGRMEFGPRALGARSILADPRHPGMRDLINARVKKREEFRPFAPAVLADRANLHFDLPRSSPFMLETCQVKSWLDLPAITHVDGSARVQTVDRNVLPRFAGLLETFERRTGCPLLLNTSFNMRDEPIVCTPTDAVICFLRAGIESLVIEDFIVDRDALGPMWDGLLARAFKAQDVKGTISHLVYSFE